MMIQEDVIGLPLHKAAALLSEREIAWKTEEIFPRGRTDVSDGVLRVIKTTKSQNDQLIVTVCRVPMPDLFGTGLCSEK